MMRKGRGDKAMRERMREKERRAGAEGAGEGRVVGNG
jgi:hypothetical protein